MEVKNVIISDINSEGLGVGRSGEFEKVLFVKNAVVGEKIDASILKESKNFAIAEVIRTKKESDLRTAPKCIHFGNCGGCSVQHVSYQGQLEFKKTKVLNAVKKIAKIEGVKIEDVSPSPKQFNYRNKMDFAFSSLPWITNEEENRERRVLGMHTLGRFDRVLNIKECHLIYDEINKIRNFIREFCISQNASFWNPKTKIGKMRDLICKTNNKGEIFLVIIFGEQPKVLQADLCMALKKNFSSISSICWGVNKKEMNFLEETKLYMFMGEDHIMQNLLGLEFKIGAKSFCQINQDVAEQMISKVLEVGEFKKDDIVFDLYSGIGTFSLHIAKHVKKVLGIESSINAVNNARENAQNNNIQNIKFIKNKVEDCINEGLIIENGKPNVIICDPPRNGIDKKTLEKICEFGVEKLIYVSCNPASFARDCLVLKEHYKLENVIPFDMFPQTTHVEIVAIFKKP